MIKTDYSIWNNQERMVKTLNNMGWVFLFLGMGIVAGGILGGVKWSNIILGGLELILGGLVLNSHRLWKKKENLNQQG